MTRGDHFVELGVIFEYSRSDTLLASTKALRWLWCQKKLTQLCPHNPCSDVFGGCGALLAWWPGPICSRIDSYEEGTGYQSWPSRK